MFKLFLGSSCDTKQMGKRKMDRKAAHTNVCDTCTDYDSE